MSAPVKPVRAVDDAATLTRAARIVRAALARAERDRKPVPTDGGTVRAT